MEDVVFRVCDAAPSWAESWSGDEPWRKPIEPPAELLAAWAADDAALDARLLVELLDDVAPVPALWNTLTRLPETPLAAPSTTTGGPERSVDGTGRPAPAGDQATRTLGAAGQDDQVGEGERVDRMRAWSRVAAYAQAMVMHQIAALSAHRDPAPTRIRPTGFPTPSSCPSRSPTPCAWVPAPPRTSWPTRSP